MLKILDMFVFPIVLVRYHITIRFNLCGSSLISTLCIICWILSFEWASQITILWLFLCFIRYHVWFGSQWIISRTWKWLLLFWFHFHGLFYSFEIWMIDWLRCFWICLLILYYIVLLFKFTNYSFFYCCKMLVLQTCQLYQLLCPYRW